jgi:hypothetical protein
VLRVSNRTVSFPFRAAWSFLESEGSITLEHDFQLGKQGEDYHAPYIFPRKQEQRQSFKTILNLTDMERYSQYR